MPEIQVSAPQARLLEILCRTVNARRILEFGTLGGYSTIAMARTLPADGLLTTLEFAVVVRKMAGSPDTSEWDQHALGLDSPRAIGSVQMGSLALAFALASSRVYPTVKYALGHGKACTRLTVGGKPLPVMKEAA